jgi:hypothetical protein
MTFIWYKHVKLFHNKTFCEENMDFLKWRDFRPFTVDYLVNALEDMYTPEPDALGLKTSGDALGIAKIALEAC